MFRRRRATDDVADDDFDDEYDDVDDSGSDDDDDDVDEVDEVDAPRAAVPAEPTHGPWDVAHLPKDDPTPRVDLGGVLVPIPQGVELRVEVVDDVVVAAALVDGNSQLLVSAFAAPKSSGIWDDVRTEIADSLRTSGGSGELTTGPFGQELRSRIPDESGSTQPARFLGVDGPRWFLRGLITGAAATDSLRARRLEEVFRGIVVNRGGDAMAPRDPLPLHLPREALEATAVAEDDEDAPLELQLQERGPEITETR
ncbi:MAG TPA: DUF3710 domain-containing protein [Mycobacteriales bacterium]|nr:DUF3710 domain-containing protein [Mycobacteriales bacterium]